MAAPPECHDKPGTLFPKITGRVEEFVTNISLQQQDYPDIPTSTSILLTGTAKLHGMHADIVINSNNEVRLQSRNLHSLSLSNDLQGYAAHMLPLYNEIIKIKDRIHARFLKLNPHLTIDDQNPLIIAGEWIGPGIQKKVAISELPSRLFVIISININNIWVPDEPYGDIHSEKVGIYHVSTGGFFHHQLQLEEAEDSLMGIQPLADEVERECPFGKAFGIIGRGEGIVWKPAAPLCHDARSWIKMKGPLSKVAPVAERKVEKGTKEQKAYAHEFAKSVVNEMRLEQGWQYMEEMRIQRDKKGIPAYLDWLLRDVDIEEGRIVRERGIDQSVLRKEITPIGREWYIARLKEAEMKEVLGTVGKLDLKEP